MLLDREALRGIYYALSTQDTAAVQAHCVANGVMETHFDSERRLEIVHSALVALGHVPPPDPTDAGAAEYQDAMDALALMGD